MSNVGGRSTFHHVVRSVASSVESAELANVLDTFHWALVCFEIDQGIRLSLLFAWPLLRRKKLLVNSCSLNLCLHVT